MLGPLEPRIYIVGLQAQMLRPQNFPLETSGGLDSKLEETIVKHSFGQKTKNGTRSVCLPVWLCLCHCASVCWLVSLSQGQSRPAICRTVSLHLVLCWQSCTQDQVLSGLAPVEPGTVRQTDRQASSRRDDIGWLDNAFTTLVQNVMLQLFSLCSSLWRSYRAL